MGRVFTMITKVFVLCFFAALSSADDRTLDWTQLLGAGVGAATGAVPGAATGGSNSASTAAASFLPPWLQSLASSLPATGRSDTETDGAADLNIAATEEDLDADALIEYLKSCYTSGYNAGLTGYNGYSTGYSPYYNTGYSTGYPSINVLPTTAGYTGTGLVTPTYGSYGNYAGTQGNAGYAYNPFGTNGLYPYFG